MPPSAMSISLFVTMTGVNLDQESSLAYLDDNNGFLDNVVDFGLNQVQQCADTSLSSLFNLDSTTPDCTYGLPDKVHINFSRIPREELG
jgi:hypothetical protein